jgi:UDP-N-acetylmuramyl pentapeptide phosphotransferase/UDP-N-acetylglucosamine-1-phosphate transferase
MSSVFSGDETAPFFGFLGAAAALVFSCTFPHLLALPCYTFCCIVCSRIRVGKRLEPIRSFAPICRDSEIGGAILNVRQTIVQFDMF